MASPCEISEDVLKVYKKFRMRRAETAAALINFVVPQFFTVKCDLKTQTVVLEDEIEDISLEDLREELPERVP
eukprot:Pgem_evm1s9888